MLAQEVGADAFELRHILKQPLTIDELTDLAARVGGPKELVAPKQRAEAEGLDGKKLLAWLAEDGGRVRRPIIITRRGVTLGFGPDARAALAKLL